MTARDPMNEQPPTDVLARLTWEEDRHRERMERARKAKARPAHSSGDPLRLLGDRCWPTDVLPPTDPGDIRGWCAYCDAVMNRGAGAPREAR